jgi:hypothetical protein
MRKICSQGLSRIPSWLSHVVSVTAEVIGKMELVSIINAKGGIDVICVVELISVISVIREIAFDADTTGVVEIICVIEVVGGLDVSCVVELVTVIDFVTRSVEISIGSK